MIKECRWCGCLFTPTHCGEEYGSELCKKQGHIKGIRAMNTNDQKLINRRTNSLIGYYKHREKRLIKNRDNSKNYYHSVVKNRKHPRIKLCQECGYVEVKEGYDELYSFMQMLKDKFPKELVVSRLKR